MAGATRFYVNGTWTDPVSSERANVLDPSTGQGFAQVALANDALWRRRSHAWGGWTCW